MNEDSCADIVHKRHPTSTVTTHVTA